MSSTPSEDINANSTEAEELFIHHEFDVAAGQAPERIDKWLTVRLEYTSRNKLQNAAKSGAIQVNGKAVKVNYKVRPGDHIEVVTTEAPRQIELIPQDIPLDIIFEDEHLVVINKPPGLVVHPGYGNYSGTLVNALVYHFNKQNISAPSMSSEQPRPGLVHRLDKDTSGLMVIAKDDYALQDLAKQFFDRTIYRRYVALAWGNIDEDSGVIEGNIGRDLRIRQKMDVFPEGDFGKTAITDYTVLERFGYCTLVECKLRTGRTHQIRVHMRHLGHPLFNDETYGGDRIVKGTVFTKYKQFVDNCFSLLPRQALHARALGFIHPYTKQEIKFESELPDNFMAVIEKWRTYSKGMTMK